MKKPSQYNYVLMDPSGNRTILVKTAVPEAEQPAVAAALMALEPTAEQVGFLMRLEGEQAVSLRMAGGEFCGNAAMSAAVYYGMCAGMTCGEVTVRVCGLPEPVPVRISSEPDGVWRGEVEMPRPLSVKAVRFPEGDELPVIAFPGISHVILERALPRKTAEALIVRWCDFLGADALGLMFLDLAGGRMTPLVYVPAADTMYWERACGSGLSAVGAWLARERGREITLSLRQPGGAPEITAAPDGPLLLRGKVALACNLVEAILQGLFLPEKS